MTITRTIVAILAAGLLSSPTPPVSQTTVTEKNVTASSARRRPVTPVQPTPAMYDASQMEAYLTEDGLAYIRPGLKIKVNSITIGSDRKPVVDVSFTDNFDQPIDRLGKTTPGPISASFILAWWDPIARHYTSYITRTVTTPANSPRPGVTAKQATTDSGGVWTDLQTGRATYKFNNALPEGFDQTKTHTLGLHAFRNLTNIPAVGFGKNYYANLEHDFRPDGQKVTDTWAKINDTTSCLACHDKETFGFHGSSARRDVKLCVLCHQPQTTDPDTGNTVDLKVMIHKIHAPGELSAPYIIYGNNQSVHNYSQITYPQDVRNCDNCHEGITPTARPAQSDAWYTKPSREACGSCHDDIEWATGKNHPGGAQADSASCAKCHVADSGEEFDASIKGAHVIPEKSKQLKGLKAEIVSVTDLAPGKNPTVVFKITNGDGSAVDGTKLATFAPILTGPSSSYTKYWREDARAKGIFDAATGTTTYTCTATVPADATGTWTMSADIYRNATLKRADGKADITLREAAQNPIKYVAVKGSLAARRTVVTMAQCNQCHDRLALHGGQRMMIEECVICHNPTQNDQARRPAAAGQPESISFQRMIHRIHSGEQLDNDFTVYGFGNTAHTYNEVLFPGDRRNCAKCHTANSHRIPPPSGDPVITLRDFFSPQGPGTAACLGCHDSKDAAAHAYLNTTTFGGQQIGEACGACHGTNKDWAVDKVHSR